MNDNADNASLSGDIPILNTPRLVLRPFAMADAKRVQLLAGAWEVANTVGTIPHPYPDGAAEQWIAEHAQAFRDGSHLTLAVCMKDETPEGTLIGAVSLMGFRTRSSRAELGYWIGKDYWDRGYGTEAVREIVRYGFEQLGLHRVFGQHLARNPASGRVMQKAGLKREGRLRQHFRRWEDFEDMDVWGLLQSEWNHSACMA
jgi:RimJ/RimL family protein N-acetyltransferase